MAPSPLWDLGFKSNNCHNVIMGRTIPTYRIASQIEIWKWKWFRKALDKQDRRKFDEMLSIPRLYKAAGTMACRPILIHVILISIIFEHY
jgi:hypothetical protein